MRKGDVHIEFTEDFATHKKGSKVYRSRDLANRLFIRGVAKKAKKVSTTKKAKAKKDK